MSDDDTNITEYDARTRLLFALDLTKGLNDSSVEYDTDLVNKLRKTPIKVYIEKMDTDFDDSEIQSAVLRSYVG